MARRNNGHLVLVGLLGFSWCVLNFWPEPEVIASPTPPGRGGAEETFALHRRYPLERIEVGDLVTIPGVSDALATRIVSQRTEIRACARLLKAGAQHRALEVVKGIGEKTAKKLAGYLDFGPAHEGTVSAGKARPGTCPAGKKIAATPAPTRTPKGKTSARARKAG